MGPLESVLVAAARGLAACRLARRVAAIVRRRPSSRVRAFRADAEALGPLGPRRAGIRTVEVARIVGSVGRSHELAADFRPRRRRDEDEYRYRRVCRAIEQGRALPVIELYQLGDAYYVVDGHHRVAAFRRIGQLDAEASVTAFVPLVSVVAEGQAARDARHDNALVPRDDAPARPLRRGAYQDETASAAPGARGDCRRASPHARSRTHRRAPARSRGNPCSFRRRSASMRERSEDHRSHAAVRGSGCFGRGWEAPLAPRRAFAVGAGLAGSRGHRAAVRLWEQADSRAARSLAGSHGRS